MKKIIALLLLGFIAFGASACGTATEEEEIKEFVKEYKSKLHNIENPQLLKDKSVMEEIEISKSIAEKIEPYITEEVLDDFVIKRWFTRKFEIAQTVDKKVKLEDVTLEKVEENEDGSIDYDYIMKINYYDEESEQIIEKEGQLTIVNDDGWEITRDWERITKFEKEAMRQYVEEMSLRIRDEMDDQD